MASETELWNQLGVAIREHPELDEPRIAFAAELDATERRKVGADTVSPRAELIYAQLKLARMSPDHPEWFRIAIRVRSLLITHQTEWIPERIAATEVTGCEFHRGFVAKITASPRVLFEHAGALFADAPIEHLDLVGIENDFDLEIVLRALKRVDAISRIRSLGLDSQRLEEVESLNLPAWTGLRWLSLRHNRINASNAAILLKTAPPSLRSVDLYGNKGDPAERLQFDQGIVISTAPPLEDEFLSHNRLIERHVAYGVELHADRFAADYKE